MITKVYIYELRTEKKLPQERWCWHLITSIIVHQWNHCTLFFMWILKRRGHWKAVLIRTSSELRKQFHYLKILQATQNIFGFVSSCLHKYLHLIGIYSWCVLSYYDRYCSVLRIIISSSEYTTSSWPTISLSITPSITCFNINKPRNKLAVKWKWKKLITQRCWH